MCTTKDRTYPVFAIRKPAPLNTQSSSEKQSACTPPQGDSSHIIIENDNIADDVLENMDFTVKSIRLGFIRKVYGLVLSQLVITAVIIFLCMWDERVPRFTQNNLALVLVPPLVVYFTTFICMLCCEGPRRKVPYNYIFLLLFTLSTATMTGVACSFCRREVVIFAAVTTFVMVTALTVFAFQTKIDFTLLTGSVLSIVLALIILGIAVLTTTSPKLNLVYATLGIIVISIYIVWDTQMIIGGTHRYKFSPEEYVFAAVILYIDITYLFLKLLRFAR